MPVGNPYKNFRFLVEVEGIIQAGFTECSGIGSSVEVIEYREGGDQTNVRKLPGRTSYSDIVLKWGITDSRELYDWHVTAIAGNVERKSGSIILQNDAGEEKIRWNFYQAWPSKWDGPELNSTGNEVAIASLTVSCNRLERV